MHRREVGRRRFFLSAAGVVLAARFGPACGSDSSSPQPAGPLPGSAGRFARLRELRDALRQSPDNLRAQADALVAQKDARKLFAFVRDNIRTVPPFEANASIETAVRFGVDNVLRTGAGTPRERAELLAQLLNRAGFQASIVKGSPDGPLFSSDAPATVYLRNIELPFLPGEPPTGTWADRAPQGAAPPAFLDLDGVRQGALYATLRPLVPADASIQVPYLAGLADMPFVALDEGGNTTYLNPLLPTAEYGQSYAMGIAPAGPLAPAKSVTVRTQLTRARDPGTPIELVMDTYRFDELAGARLRVSFQPTLPLPIYLRSKPDEVTTFVSGLALVAGSGVLGRVTSGAGVSVFGDVLDASAGTVSGVPLARGGNPSAVTAIEVTAQAHAFPVVELEIAPRDANGVIVAGLPASAFQIEEQGELRSAVLRENGGGPRVLVMRDGTGSQPPVDANFGTSVGQAILNAMPGARVQVVGLDGSPAGGGYTLTEASAIGAALSSAGGASSPVFGGLARGVASSPTLIIVLTDGDGEKEPGVRAQCLAALASCPVLVVGCYVGSASLMAEPLQAIAAASGGKLVDAGALADPSLVNAAIAELGGRRSATPYRLAYQARRNGDPTRNVVVRAGAQGTTSYMVPTAAFADSEIIGIHLRVELDGEVVERTVAGLPVGAVVASPEQITAAASATRDFMLGTAWLTFEGSAPTLSAWLDDALNAAIGYEKVQLAIDAKDVQGAYSALADAPTRPLISSLLAHAPLRLDDASKVIETSLRTALHVVTPLTERARVDLLPTTRFVAIGVPDGAQAFQASLRGSLRLAVAEEAIAHGSTSAELGAKPLALLRLGLLGKADLPPVPAASQDQMLRVLNEYADWHRIVAADGSSLAFWAIHAATGSALGVLPDGSGGALEDCKSIVDFASTQMDLLVLLVGQIEAGLANTTAIIAAVGKAATIAVAEAALSFTDPLLDPSIWQLGAVLVCEGAKTILGNNIPVPKAVPKVVGDYLAGFGADKALGNDSICKAAAPCTGTQ